jgi:SAM-dependent methyltransferase
LKIRQDSKFIKRKRNEDPNYFREKLKNDEYLLSVYKTITESAYHALKVDPTIESGRVVLELGSSGGITNELFPDVITSDIRSSSGLAAMVDGMCLPFRDNSLNGIIAKDILHHLPDPVKHFTEVVRTLKVGARIVYIEPNWNILSRIVFTLFHPEPFEANQKEWTRKSNGPMDSNQALARIIFERDIELFKKLYPQLSVRVLDPVYGVSFLLAGGVYSRSKVPAKVLIMLAKIESKSPLWLNLFGLNRLIVLEKI